MFKTIKYKYNIILDSGRTDFLIFLAGFLNHEILMLVMNLSCPLPH